MAAYQSSLAQFDDKNVTHKIGLLKKELEKAAGALAKGDDLSGQNNRLPTSFISTLSFFGQLS